MGWSLNVSISNKSQVLLLLLLLARRSHVEYRKAPGTFREIDMTVKFYLSFLALMAHTIKRRTGAFHETLQVIKS